MLDKDKPDNQLAATADIEAIRHLRQAIASGQHWYPALLEAVRLWNISEETSHGRTYRYLIAGEALDWLLVAERLCQAVDGWLPEDARDAFLFHGKPPLELPSEEFKKLIGSLKYRQYLNYFYGITVEEALVLAVQEEVRKERWAAGYWKEQDTTNEAYRRIYGATRAILLRRFRRSRGYPLRQSISLTELKEFTYWLFKYRLKHCDKARVASDTKKALDWLKSKGFSRQPEKPHSKSGPDISPQTSAGQAMTSPSPSPPAPACGLRAAPGP